MTHQHQSQEENRQTLAAGLRENAGGGRTLAPPPFQLKRSSLPLQRQETSFPEGMDEESLKQGMQMKRQPGLPLQRRPAGPVLQRRGGATVGRLCIVSNVNNEGLLAGHAWLSYTPTGGSETTYGTWGNVDPIGLHRDREVGRAYKARRCTDIDADDLATLDSYATANDRWSYTNNCASFAARGWLRVTGEPVAYTTWGIPNPSALGAGITALGGELAAGTGGGSSASSGSSYGSSSLNSSAPGSSG